MAQDQRDEDQPGLDPIALTLAVWLGVIAGTTGLVRVSPDAAAQTALARSGQMQAGVGAAQTAEPTPLISLCLTAVGG